MTELEALKQQRKEIDKRIKELTTTDVKYQYAKFYRDPRPGVANFNYCVAIEIPELRLWRGQTKHGSRYSTVCRAETRDGAIQSLERAIETLQGLYDKVTTENKEEE